MGREITVGPEGWEKDEDIGGQQAIQRTCPKIINAIFGIIPFINAEEKWHYMINDLGCECILFAACVGIKADLRTKMLEGNN